MPHSLPNRIVDLSDRLERHHDCTATVGDLFHRYHAACRRNAWAEADQIRVLLMESVEAQLDAVAAVFKSFGEPDGQGS